MSEVQTTTLELKTKEGKEMSIYEKFKDTFHECRWEDEPISFKFGVILRVGEEKSYGLAKITEVSKIEVDGEILLKVTFMEGLTDILSFKNPEECDYVYDTIKRNMHPMSEAEIQAWLDKQES